MFLGDGILRLHHSGQVYPHAPSLVAHPPSLNPSLCSTNIHPLISFPDQNPCHCPFQDWGKYSFPFYLCRLGVRRHHIPHKFAVNKVGNHGAQDRKVDNRATSTILVHFLDRTISWWQLLPVITATDLMGIYCHRFITMLAEWPLCFLCQSLDDSTVVPTSGLSEWDHCHWPRGIWLSQADCRNWCLFPS